MRLGIKINLPGAGFSDPCVSLPTWGILSFYDSVRIIVLLR